MPINKQLGYNNFIVLLVLLNEFHEFPDRYMMCDNVFLEAIVPSFDNIGCLMMPCQNHISGANLAGIAVLLPRAGVPLM